MCLNAFAISIGELAAGFDYQRVVWLKIDQNRVANQALDSDCSTFVIESPEDVAGYGVDEIFHQVVAAATVIVVALEYVTAIVPVAETVFANDAKAPPPRIWMAVVTFAAHATTTLWVDPRLQGWEPAKVTLIEDPVPLVT